jgi:hypothetical protein
MTAEKINGCGVTSKKIFSQTFRKSKEIMLIIGNKQKDVFKKEAFKSFEVPFPL